MGGIVDMTGDRLAHPVDDRKHFRELRLGHGRFKDHSRLGPGDGRSDHAARPAGEPLPPGLIRFVEDVSSTKASPLEGGRIDECSGHRLAVNCRLSGHISRVPAKYSRDAAHFKNHANPLAATLSDITMTRSRDLMAEQKKSNLSGSIYRRSSSSCWHVVYWFVSSGLRRMRA